METDPPRPALKRTLGLTSLVLYGMGTIIGAGIYILVGEVAGVAGMAAPVSFVLAGVVAALTGLSYAELAARYPEAAGAAAYLKHAFNAPRLGTLTGIVICAIAVIVAASLARGGVGYLSPLFDVSAPVAGAVVVIVFTAIACRGVAESVFLAAALTVVEIGGLFVVIGLGAPALETLPARWTEMIPDSSMMWAGVGAGAFLSFFAFSGFETLATLAEEAKDGARAIPRAIVLTIAITAILYVTIIIVAILSVSPADLAASSAPLCEIVDCQSWAPGRLFPAVALTATLNGVLIEIVMASRVVYGMAVRGWLPAYFAKLHPVRQTPIAATLGIGILILILTVGVPFEGLVRTTSTLLLIVFFGVNVALFRLHLTQPRTDLPFSAPRWTPLVGALTCVALMIAELSIS